MANKSNLDGMRRPSRPVVARILLTLILVGILVFLIAQLLGTDNASKDTIPAANQPPAVVQNDDAKSKGIKNPQKAKPTTPPSTPTGPSTPTTPAPTTNKTTSPDNAPPTTKPAPQQNLTNTGPGSIVAIFVGTVMLTALVHNRFVGRRLVGQQF